MSTEFEMLLEFGFCNGAMGVNVYADDVLIDSYHGNTSSLVTVRKDINLPCTVKVELSGKTNKDTRVEDGEIVEDKYVKLVGMRLGRIPVNDANMFKVCTTDDGRNDVFWGRNGTVEININEKDFVLWHLRNDNLFDI